MSVECITCERFSFRDCDLARHGFGLCALRPRWENYPATNPRECAHHKPADADKVAARRQWLARFIKPTSSNTSSTP